MRASVVMIPRAGEMVCGYDARLEEECYPNFPPMQASEAHWPIFFGVIASTRRPILSTQLAGPLAGSSPGLRLGLGLVLALKIERHGSADKILQGRLIDLVAFVDIDGAPDIPLEAGVEQTRRVLQYSSLGKGHFDHALVCLSRAHDAATGKDGNSRRRRLNPFPLFDDLRICGVYDFTHPGERLPAPVRQVLDLFIH